MSTEADPPIIVQGGGQTTSISFNQETFAPGASGTYASESSSITRVVVVVGGQTVLDETVKDGDATISVYYS